MTVDQLEVIWFGLRDNISIIEIHHQTELLALISINTLVLINIEEELNKEINSVIIPKDTGDRTILNLKDTKIEHVESVIKYVRLMKRFKSLKLSNANINTKKVTALSRDISSRAISLTMLDLSHNKEINDKSCRAIRAIFSSKSPIKHLNLDGTRITQKGFAVIMEGTNDNLKVREISLQKTRIKIKEGDPSREKIVEAL